ncbi:MAG: type IV secretion system DNA-binding domain-containing protein [Anaerolineae bacterium]|jgi:hypothetical protein|nr:type IV secretion system DNA-binding domain-containing protein [Anaerolineae bacterium]
MDFEKLGAFYLGKTYDLKSQKLGDELVMYDARDLTTHAVCVGMTGSGKTGLCLDLLEEAAIDRVPAIIVDPKGDITNLLLTFPELRPEDFRPWINVDDARRKGLSEDEFAAKQADLWRSGLAEWGQDGERIRRLRETADFVIYTPGSDAGVPVSILQSFAAPPLSWDDDAELLRERVQGTVSALLGLVGIEADPVRSREHILLSTLFEHFWRQGEDLDLAKLILAIQTPPIRQLGVFDVDTFFPQKDRFELAMGLNNIIAAPSFQSWLQGQPLDIAGFLGTAEGKPRHAIFYIAHLSDAERMFFVTMLLNQLVTWMRTQPGTTSLRALFYMDEIFGFFPPISNPPSKLPLLTLLKQARAFGLGCVLTTQNPADLDYKGLTNAGTWFIGRLQAERDKERLLDGLESASAQAGEALDRAALSKIVSGLGSRVFLLHNVHEEAPVIFQTRWAMSYLRGPLTRTQVRELMGKAKPDQTAAAAPAAATTAQAASPVAAVSTAASATVATVPPALPAGIQQVYLPLKVGAASADLEVEKRAGGQVAVQSRKVFYAPALLGMGQVHFTKQTKGLSVDESTPFALLAQPPSGVGGVRWDEAQSLKLTPRDLIDRPEPEACFDVLPERMNEVREFTALQKDLEDHLYRTSSLTLFYSPAAKVYSEPGEDIRAFKMRLTQEARELRDAEVDKLEDRYSAKLKTLEERLRKAKATLAKKEADARTRKQDALLSAGETIISLFAGRRRSISSAATKVSRASTANIDVEAAEEQIEAVQQEMQTLQETLKQETDAIVAQWDAALEKIEEVAITPKRTDVELALFVLAWMPHWQIAYQSGSVTQAATLAAY